MFQEAIGYVGYVSSLPGQSIWEWTKKHPSRRDVEISQHVVGVFSGILGYCFPKASVLAPFVTCLLVGGNLYGMSKEENMDFDYDVEAKKLAIRSSRLAIVTIFGFNLGTVARWWHTAQNEQTIFFSKFVSIESNSIITNIASRISTFPSVAFTMLYLPISFIDWYVKPQPLQR